tara:strand:+ start:2721 stop:3002 length:282 start_codon:yes stop_codon:yes gene_type:complete
MNYQLSQELQIELSTTEIGMSFAPSIKGVKGNITGHQVIQWWSDLGKQNRFALYMMHMNEHNPEGFSFKDPETLSLYEIAQIYYDRRFLPLTK